MVVEELEQLEAGAGAESEAAPGSFSSSHYHSATTAALSSHAYTDICPAYLELIQVSAFFLGK